MFKHVKKCLNKPKSFYRIFQILRMVLIVRSTLGYIINLTLFSLSPSRRLEYLTNIIDENLE